MTIKNSKRHCRGSKSKAKKEWEKRERASRPRPRHEPITKKRRNLVMNTMNAWCVMIVFRLFQIIFKDVGRQNIFYALTVN